MPTNDLRGVLLTLAAALACSAGPRLPQTAGATVLEVGGAVRGGPFRLGAAEIAALPQADVRGVDPRTGTPARYEGLAIAALEDRVELERGADTVVLRGAGGEVIPIPLSVVRQLRPVLATRSDGAALEPSVVAWPNVRHHGVATDPRAPLWWVRRVVKIDFVAWQPAFGKALRVPEGAARGALAGARTFGARCLGCHGLRGVGGANGPALDRGGAFTDPAGLRAALRAHPAFPGPNVAPDAEELGDLAAFLRVVAATPPEDAGGEPAP